MKIRIRKFGNHWLCIDPIQGAFNWDTWNEAVADAIEILKQRYSVQSY